MNVDILYTARNRQQFVEMSFHFLLKNTDWSKVNKLTVYDDGSKDGTKTWLERQIVSLNLAGKHPPIELLHTQLHSPPALMNHFLSRTSADAFAKIDSDIACPKGWLNSLLDVMERNPELELLGMEAGQTEMVGRDGKPFDGTYGWWESSHIGGVGLMRTERFRHLPPIPERGYFGWTEYQDLYRWVRGWIAPDLAAPQLDKIPTEFFREITHRHRLYGWSRDWGFYDDSWCRPYYQWVLESQIVKRMAKGSRLKLEVVP